MLNNIIGLTEQQFIGFFLAFVRISALLTIAPFLGSQTIPVKVRVFLAFFLTLTLLPMLKASFEMAEVEMFGLFPLTMRELLVGLFLGFVAKFMFESFQFAGRLISTQIGLGMSELVDPENGAQVTVIGNFYSLLAIVLFLILNGHHLLLSALYRSFELAPVGSLKIMSVGAKAKMLTMFNEIFTMGIKLAAPTMVTLFLVEVSMGIMARVVPQMNIFVIGLPIRLGVGLMIIITTMPLFYLFFNTMLSAWKQDVNGILNYF